MKIPAFGMVMLVSCLTTSLGGCSPQELSVKDPWIPEAPPNASALAGYMSLNNATGRVKTLTGGTSDTFERIEIHETVYEKESGLARMVRRDSIRIGAGQSFNFEPGGHHLMLINPKRRLREGERVPLSLLFADGSRRTVDFQVRSDHFRL